MNTQSATVSKAKPDTSTASLHRALGGILVRRERWGLSLRGWIALLVVVVLAGVGLFRGVFPFLAVSDPQPPSDYLVAEGWVPVEILKQADDEFKKGAYKKILVSGCIVYDEWSEGKRLTWADWGASKLRRIGAPADVVQPVPCFVEKKDRTYSSALAVKQWLIDHGGQPKTLNVVTCGSHARRTWLLYREAFGKGTKVGIISFPDPEFDTKVWWRTSEGVRAIIGEGIAYLYARFLFRPPV
jgi:hypothetical protein